MSQRDQSGPNQQPGANGRGASANRRDERPGDEFDLPAWGDASSNARSSGRPSRPNRPASVDATGSGSPSRRARSADSFPSLGDALDRREARRRPAYTPESETDATASTDDAYDRLRGRSTRQRRADWGASADPYSDRRRYPGEAQTRRPRTVPARQFRAPNMGAAVEFANQFERPVVITAGIGVVSLVLMAATVAARQGQLAAWFPIHLNAAGAPDQWGSPATLWRLPLMALMVSLMAVVIAWLLAKRDAFATQFILASTLLIQALCWIAVIHLAW